ncbi:MAG: aldo/keto reductase [Deltaproteobacteria bacterium]|jgi:predicted aldo/keto reductase-like oxidoreductase|nr:aldo/keto reductase [Deltaproteobacteria bacterium]
MIEKRAMGKTGDSSSILGFGCMRLPLKGPKPGDIDLELAQKMVRSAIDRGVDYVDTAYVYHTSGAFGTSGASEPFLAQALKDGYRQRVKIATKLPLWTIKSKADMNKFLDLQLKNLDTNYIDYYLAHGFGNSTWEPMKELKILEFFDEAVKDGRILYPSFSFHDEYPLFETILKSYDWSMCQIQYNFLDTKYQAGQAGLKLAAQRNVAIVIMEPLRGGFLVRFMPSEAEQFLKEARPDWSLAAWCLNWLWNQPEVGVVLSGMSDMAQVDDNVSVAQKYRPGTFTQADEALIQRVQVLFQDRIKVNCTGCGYCQPCPSGVDIPQNLSFLNQYNMFEAQEARNHYKWAYGLMVPATSRADLCVSCGECVDRCPQGIPIPEFLDQTVKTFQG